MHLTVKSPLRPSLTMFCCFRYTLFAVVNHSGTLEVGHYTSFIRQQQQVRIWTGQCFISLCLTIWVRDSLTTLMGISSKKHYIVLHSARTRFWLRIRIGKSSMWHAIYWSREVWNIQDFSRYFCAFFANNFVSRVLFLSGLNAMMRGSLKQLWTMFFKVKGNCNATIFVIFFALRTIQYSEHCAR